MTSNKKEEETKLTYDERRKILNQKKTQITENMTEEVKDEDGKVTEKPKLISTVKQSMEVEYTEAGIRLAHDNLSKENEGMDKMPEDLVKLKDLLQAIGKYDASEKARVEHKEIKKRLKTVRAEIKSITDEIGTRLKF